MTSETTELYASLAAVLKPLNSAKELAELSGMSEARLSEWRTQGIGPTYVKIGRRVMYPKEALLDYLRDHTVHTAA